MQKKKIFLILLIFLSIFSCKSYEKMGLQTKTTVYNADNVDFYYDLTYKKDGATHYERQIWDQAYDILDNAHDFFLMDIFVFNDWVGKGVEEKLHPLPITEEFAQKILEKKLVSRLLLVWRQPILVEIQFTLGAGLEFMIIFLRTFSKKSLKLVWKSLKTLIF